MSPPVRVCYHITRRAVGALVALAWSFRAVAASSQEASGAYGRSLLPEPHSSQEAPARRLPPPPDPEMQLRASTEPEPVAPVDAATALPPPGARLHDGFYLRFALGANYGRSFVQTNRVSKADVRLVGMGRALDVWLGRTLPLGVVLGVNLSVTELSSDAAEVGDDATAAGNSWGFQLGGFLDTYPNLKEGYHFGGSVSLAAVTAHAETVRNDYVGGGLGVSVFAGYDAWIGPQLSLGGLLRLGGAVTRGNSDEDGPDVTKQGTSYGAQLMATLVYH